MTTWEKFHDWYVTNQDSITWFLIGVLLAQGADQFGRGNYMWTAILWALALSNYLLRRVRVS